MYPLLILGEGVPRVGLPGWQAGAIGGIGGVLLLAAGAWLFRVVRPERRSVVARSMMIVGGLMAASMLLRAYEALPADGSLDVPLMIFGGIGFLTLLVGFALFRQVNIARQDAEK